MSTVSNWLVSSKIGLTAFAVLVCLTAIFRSFGQSTSSVLTIISKPSAVVFVDDIRFGTTDPSGKLVIKDLDGNRHTVRVRADGFKEVSKTVTSSTGDVNVPLTKTADEAELAFQEAERQLSLDRQSAAAAYRKAIKLRPNYTAAYIGLARVLSDSGDLEGALKAIGELRRFAPSNAEASAVEGRVYKEEGEEQEAIAAFKRSISQGRGFQPEAFTGLGLLYKEKAESAGAAGNFDEEAVNYAEAAKDLTAAVKQLSSAPDAVILYQLLGLVYEKQKKFDDAIRVYNEFLRRFPDSPEAPTIRSFIVQIKKQQQ